MIASTSAIKQGLHVTAEVVTDSSRSLHSMQKRLLTTLVALDLYVSSILGLPPVVNIDTAGSILRATREPTQATNKSFFGDRTVPRSLLASSGDLASKYNQLISLTAGIMWDLSASASNRSDSPGHDDGLDASILKQAERDMGSWFRSLGIVFSPSMTEDDDYSANASVSKHDLEMTFYWSQLVVYSPFLHYLRSMADSHPIPESLSKPALTSLKYAVNVIVRCEKRLLDGNEHTSNKPGINPSDWCTIYTLFLAILALMFLIATHEGTSKPGEAWRKAETGIRILTSLRCGDNGAHRCLAIIRELVHQLDYTVYFDLADIERTTPTVCQRLQVVPPYAGDKMSVIVNGNRQIKSSIMDDQASAPIDAISSADIMLAEAQLIRTATSDEIHNIAAEMET